VEHALETLLVLAVVFLWKEIADARCQETPFGGHIRIFVRQGAKSVGKRII
jgi:hypothetical protein